MENVILQILAEEAVGKLMIIRLWAEEGALGGSESGRPGGPAEGGEPGGTRAGGEGTDLSKAMAGK